MKRWEYRSFGTLRRRRETTPKGTTGRKSQRKETVARGTPPVSVLLRASFAGGNLASKETFT